MTWNEDAVLRGAWRRAFARSPIVREVLNAGRRWVPKFNKDGSQAKKDALEYSCETCNKWVRASVGGKKNIAVDHLVPVISTENVDGKVTDWNEYHRRLFCDIKNLRRICKACHLWKTSQERLARTIKRDTQMLTELQAKLKQAKDKNVFKKELSKYTSKKKPEVVRSMALALKKLIEA